MPDIYPALTKNRPKQNWGVYNLLKHFYPINLHLCRENEIIDTKFAT